MVQVVMIREPSCTLDVVPGRVENRISLNLIVVGGGECWVAAVICTV